VTGECPSAAHPHVAQRARCLMCGLPLPQHRAGQVGRQVGELVAHERHQGRYDEHKAAGEQRRQLVAQRLARACAQCLKRESRSLAVLG
jgi:hypothetical protein